MKEFENIDDLINKIKNDDNCLNNIKLESGRKINKTSITNIKLLINNDN